MVAKYYIYRNLHTDTFSVKYRGKVIAHPKAFEATGVEFRVSAKGRANVINTKRKLVHAYVVADSFKSMKGPILSMEPLYYNPYNTSTFVEKSSYKPIYKADTAYGYNNVIYI